MRNQFHKDTKGFTLIEMIIAFAMLGLVSLMIVGFIMTGTRSYSRQNAAANVQMEAQLTLNQLSDRIIDTSRAIAYKEGSEDALLTIFNEDEIYLVRWVKADEKLYASAITGDFSGITDATDLDLSQAKWSVLAEYMTGFSVDISQIKDRGQLYIHLTLNDMGQKYETTGHITLRNNLLVNESDIEIIYPNAPDEIVSSVTGVTISIGTKILNGGGTTPIHATVTGTGYPNQEVIWYIIGSSSTQTAVVGGNLVIGPDETAEVITVKAVSIVNPDAYDTVNVTIKGVLSMTVTPEHKTLKPGDRQQFTATVKGLNLDENPSSEDQAVIWSMSLSEDSDIQASLSSNGLLTIDNDSGISGTITVTAVSYINRQVSASATVVLEAEPYEGIRLTTDKTLVNRGGNAVLSVEVQGGNGNPSIEWSVAARNEDGEETTEGIHLENGHLVVSEALNFDHDYVVQVTVRIKNTDLTSSVSIRVPKVTVQIQPDVKTIDRYEGMPATSDFKCLVTGLEDYGIVWGIASQTAPNDFKDSFVTGTRIDGNKDGAAATVGALENSTVKNFYIRASLVNYLSYNDRATLIVENNTQALDTSTGENTLKNGSYNRPDKWTRIIFTPPEGYDLSTIRWFVFNEQAKEPVEVTYHKGGQTFQNNGKMIAGFDGPDKLTEMYLGSDNMPPGKTVTVWVEIKKHPEDEEFLKYEIKLTVVK